MISSGSLSKAGASFTGGFSIDDLFASSVAAAMLSGMFGAVPAYGSSCSAIASVDYSDGKKPTSELMSLCS